MTEKLIARSEPIRPNPTNGALLKKNYKLRWTTMIMLSHIQLPLIKTHKGDACISWQPKPFFQFWQVPLANHRQVPLDNHRHIPLDNHRQVLLDDHRQIPLVDHRHSFRQSQRGAVRQSQTAAVRQSQTGAFRQSHWYDQVLLFHLSLIGIERLASEILLWFYIQTDKNLYKVYDSKVGLLFFSLSFLCFFDENSYLEVKINYLKVSLQSHDC